MIFPQPSYSSPFSYIPPPSLFTDFLKIVVRLNDNPPPGIRCDSLICSRNHQPLFSPPPPLLPRPRPHTIEHSKTLITKETLKHFWFSDQRNWLWFHHNLTRTNSVTVVVFITGLVDTADIVGTPDLVCMTGTLGTDDKVGTAGSSNWHSWYSEHSLWSWYSQFWVHQHLIRL